MNMTCMKIFSVEGQNELTTTVKIKGSNNIRDYKHVRKKILYKADKQNIGTET